MGRAIHGRGSKKKSKSSDSIDKGQHIGSTEKYPSKGTNRYITRMIFIFSTFLIHFLPVFKY